MVYMANYCWYKCFNLVTWFSGHSVLTLLDLGWKHLLQRLVTFIILLFSSIENIHYHFYGGELLLVFLFFIQSVKSIFDQPQFGIILWHLKYYKWTYSKIKSPPIIDSYRKKWFRKFFYNFICFIINDNICVITLWMYCMLFISSQVVVKIISIVDWIFNLSDFLRLYFSSMV